MRLDSVSQADFDTVFLPRRPCLVGSHAEDGSSISLIESFIEAGKPVAGLPRAGRAAPRGRRRGQPLVAGKQVTGPTNTEDGVGLTDVVPFLVKTNSRRKGAGGVLEGADAEARTSSPTAC